MMDMTRGMNDGFRLKYRVSKDSDIRMAYLEILDGFSLYRVLASYAKGRTPCSYYIIARSAGEARKRFMELFPWLNIITAVEEVEGSEADVVLGDPYRYSVN